LVSLSASKNEIVFEATGVGEVWGMNQVFLESMPLSSAKQMTNAFLLPTKQ
jgi:hypothetical protein